MANYLDKKFIDKLRQDYHKREEERKEIIERSNKILHSSKRVIFSLHRGEKDKAETNLEVIEKDLADLENNFGFNRLIEEGSFKAATEEYTEAKMLDQVLTGQKLGRIKEARLARDSYIGGMCDLTGELVRLATNKAAAGDTAEVKKMKEIISAVMEELIQFDLTGYLRNKFDQAKTSLKKIEQIDYEINLKRR